MGNTASQSTKEYVSTSEKFSQTIKTSLNLENTTDLTTINIQNAQIVNGGPECCAIYVEGEYVEALPGCTGDDADLKCGEGGIAQTIAQNVTIVQQIDSEYSQDLTTQLQNQVKNDIQDALDQIQDSPGILNKAQQDSIQSTVTNINTILTTETVENIVNSAVINSYNKQTASIVNCGTLNIAGDCTNQDIAITILVQNILSSLGAFAQDNEQLNETYNTLTSTMTQTQKGPIADFFGMIASLGTAVIVAIIAGVILLGVLFIILLVFLFKGDTKKHVPTSLPASSPLSIGSAQYLPPTPPAASRTWGRSEFLPAPAPMTLSAEPSSAPVSAPTFGFRSRYK